MINIKEIEEEITKLENCNCTTYNVCSKLADLYIVKHYFQKKEDNVDMKAMSSMSSPMMTK